jgi:hypothetical protein
MDNFGDGQQPESIIDDVKYSNSPAKYQTEFKVNDDNVTAGYVRDSKIVQDYSDASIIDISSN